MTVIITFVIGLIVSAALILIAFVVIKKQLSSSVGAEREGIISQIGQTDEELAKALAGSKRFASKGQLNTLNGQLTALKADLEKEKEGLKALEPKLDQAQKNVEEKEGYQQELKTAKEEDELKLKEISEAYGDMSSQSVALEQQLASSLKNLDAIMNDLQLTADQRAVLQELSNSLSNSGSVLRDLLMEYDSINERIGNLQLQLKDLEEEYTKLVERQLGE
ncbi:MAG: hypothetical protein K1X83_04740 [Oligoflexia bacterium]|nr:hypothetical protein [Oligoflexia bacterium]